MRRALIVQLPVPQNSFGRQTGNIPLAGASLLQATSHLDGIDLTIMPESIASYLGDAAVIGWILEDAPDLIGFSTYVWNIQRVLYVARRLKERYNPRIVLGGPEVTPDNPLIAAPCIDHCIRGPAESAFARFLEETGMAERGRLPHPASFEHSASPYLTIPLEHEIERMLLLETTRGCPYRCAYCYYNKASKTLLFKDSERVREAVCWARERSVEEVYILDPSLNVRPDLKPMLEMIAACNPHQRLALSSELRAEAVDPELAALLAAAGFTSLEIGLQTVNPEALNRMRRPTDLKRFADGVGHLKQNGIACRVDLIVGLPGDTLQGFERTVQFVRDHYFDDDIQVFPLLILPGTEFRRRRHALALSYDPEPPYRVTRTPGFSERDMLTAFELAEETFDTALFPRPDLDAAWRLPGCSALEEARDVRVRIGGRTYVYKIMLHPHRTARELRELAHQVTHPYQILIPPALWQTGPQLSAIALLSELNPHTPFEVIFFDPPDLPQVGTLLQAVRLQRPHYLDNDLRFADAQPGNRAVWFTLVSAVFKPFKGPSQRSIYWWRSGALPEVNELRAMERRGFEGILIDPYPAPDLVGWQNRMATRAAELPSISFAQTAMQRRWIELTARAAYWPAVLPE